MRMGWMASPAVLALVACSGNAASGSGDGNDNGKSRQAMRSFALAGFDKVDLAGADDVRVMTGGDFAVRAEGAQAVLDKLAIDVVDGTLRIRRDDEAGWSWGGRKGATITVTMPVATAVSITGAGNLTLDRGSGDFVAAVSGTGDLAVGRIDGGDVTLRIAGSGDIGAAGVAETLDASISGAGSIRAAELVARRGAVRVSGAGAVKARVDGPARVSMSGVGSADLGPMAVCTIRTSGVGEVVCGGG